MSDLIIINGVHLVFLVGLLIATAFLIIVLLYCFFKNLVKAQKEIEDDSGPL